MEASEISLGKFRDEIVSMTDLCLTRDDPLEPLSISMPIDHIGVVLGASPYISLCSGGTSVTLSHIETIKRSTKHGQKSYRIICNDYSDPGSPRPVEYRLFTGN